MMRALPSVAARAARAAMALVLMTMVAGAGAIVSDRHLKGVRALDCELELVASEFRLWVSTGDRTLRLDEDPRKIPYQDVSETVLRFRFVPEGAPELNCDLELPAGALTCVDPAGAAGIGFCVVVP